jgi:uncharacterized SAM-binding protein YcdF (DUF218 family)
MTGFYLKKIISSILMPVPALCILLVIGFFMLLSKSRQKRGRAILGAGIVLLLIMGLGLLNRPLLGSLEKLYAPFDLNSFLEQWEWYLDEEHPAYIVVLGAGHVSDPNVPTSSKISTIGMMRVAEAVMIYRNLPHARLLTSGGSGFDPQPDGKIMAEVAIELGVPPEEIILETKALDTAAQAVAVARMIDEGPVILVTSASHMPRSMALFQEQGINPIPAPTNFWITDPGGKNPWTIADFFPSGKELYQLETAIHEYLGIAWGRLRGQL